MPLEAGTTASHRGHSPHCSVASYRRTAASGCSTGMLRGCRPTRLVARMGLDSLVVLILYVVGIVGLVFVSQS